MATNTTVPNVLVWNGSGWILGHGFVATDIQVFDTPGNHAWTKPLGNFTTVTRYVFSGGGGGGSGSRQAAVGSAGGGGGGGGGAKRNQSTQGSGSGGNGAHGLVVVVCT